MKYVLCTANKDAKTIDDLKEFAVLPREWVDGSDVELGSRFPQVIPVAVLRNQEGKILVYSRKGSEGRLHGFKSLAVGGHVDIEDIATSIVVTKDIKNSIFEGLQRELQEEAGVFAYLQEEDFEYVIYQPTDEVSSVHLGLVTVINVDEIKLGEELSFSSWFHIDEIKEEELEPLSLFILRRLKNES